MAELPPTAPPGRGTNNPSCVWRLTEVVSARACRCRTGARTAQQPLADAAPLRRAGHTPAHGRYYTRLVRRDCVGVTMRSCASCCGVVAASKVHRLVIHRLVGVQDSPLGRCLPRVTGPCPRTLHLKLRLAGGPWPPEQSSTVSPVGQADRSSHSSRRVRSPSSQEGGYKAAAVARPAQKVPLCPVRPVEAYRARRWRRIDRRYGTVPDC